ncbi:MAG: twin-arginine translocase subunit TatC [Deltaproteobacteria bacterium]|nr:twin-arginine translocase subunit TatC [Deltaproteobacteria bacterium]
MERDQIIKALEALRKSLLPSLLVVGVFSLVSFFFAKKILTILLKVVSIRVYYFTIPEVFFSMVELAILSGLFFSIPFLFFLFWKNFKTLFRVNVTYVLMAILLFYFGSVFCYMVVLKSGISFLLGYATDKIKPMISVEKYILFSGAMMFAFGLTFETPLFLLLLKRLRIINYVMLAKKRRYAVLLITIFAALITPTPDIYNMMLLAVPTYLLYEVGLIMVRIDELRRKT